MDVITEDMQRDDVTGGDRDRVRFPPCSLPFPALQAVLTCSKCCSSVCFCWY